MIDSISYMLSPMNTSSHQFRTCPPSKRFRVVQRSARLSVLFPEVRFSLEIGSHLECILRRLRSARLRRAFEELQMVKAEKSSITLGVPAFKAGWEMYAMANNFPVIQEHNIRAASTSVEPTMRYTVYELLMRSVWRTGG